jgi:hypothetical protein
MRDLIFQGVVVLLPFFYGVGIEACPKEFRDTVRYRRWVLICGALFSLITFCELGYERHKSTAERETAVEESAAKTAAILGKQYAASDASQKLRIGELEGFIQSQGKDVRDVKKYTVASTAEIHALFEQNQTGKQKRQDVKEQLRRYVGMSNMVLGTCRTVSPPGRGGTSAQVCINDARAWTFGATGYISGSLGELHLNRFDRAGLRGNAETPQGTGGDPSLDPNTASEVYWAIHEVKAKVDVLQEFIKELSQ